MQITTAIIGGTGFNQPHLFKPCETRAIKTPFGSPSAEIQLGTLFEKPIAFLARHGSPHTLPPHKVNYRANLWALNALGIRRIVGIAAVGGITPRMRPAALVLPDQLIDYTFGRDHTFHEDNLESVVHIDFTHPYTPSLRRELSLAASNAQVALVDGGVYGCTQGPRLETAAEILRMERDGCDLVGMTGMPEAGLAREIGIDYACLAVVANWAAGKEDDTISIEAIHAQLALGMTDLFRLLDAWLSP